VFIFDAGFLVFASLLLYRFLAYGYQCGYNLALA
jgi:hypothetical protein